LKFRQKNANIILKYIAMNMIKHIAVTVIAITLFTFSATVYAQDAKSKQPVASKSRSKAQSALPTADEIVKKNISVTGGAANWQKINTLKQTGGMQIQGNDISIVRTVVNNKALRVDISVGGMNGYTIITQTDGWVFLPFQGQTAPEAMTPDQVKLAQDQLDIRGELYDYKAKGSKIDYLGKDTIDGKNCYKLLLTDKNDKKETVYIDTATYYMVHSINKISANGQEMDVPAAFSDYKQQPEGILLPMTVNTQGSAIKFTTVEINKPVADSLFRPSKP
jgi:hypothetical protein